MILKVFEEFVNEINSSNSRLYKETVLDKYKENEYVKMLGERFDKFKFCEFVKDLLNLENENIASIRDTLLPKLMNGEIEV